MNVVVLGGGDSTEREVSLRSALAVAEALTTAGYEVEKLDPVDIGVLDTIKPHEIVFPILHGNNCEDGVIQREMEERNLSFLGSDSQVSSVCFNKDLTRQAFKSAGIPIAEGDVVTLSQYWNHPLASLPHVLKTNEGGSSIGTYIVNDPNMIDKAKVEEVFELGNKAVIEELVTGIEITVPVLDGKALSVIEIRPPADEEFDYLNKYNGRTQEICPPISIDQATQQKAQQYAEKAHAALGCRHLSRVDFIVSQDGSMVALEINTMPGMTNQSLYPLGAKTSGIDFPSLMTRFVEMVKRDYGI